MCFQCTQKTHRPAKITLCVPARDSLALAAVSLMLENTCQGAVLAQKGCLAEGAGSDLFLVGALSRLARLKVCGCWPTTEPRC